MLLQSPGVVDKRPSRLWSLGVAAGLLSLAALVAGVGIRADAARADEPAKKEDVKVEMLGNNQLQISGKVEQERKEENEVHYRYERTFGSFQRSFTLPDDANPDGIRGDYVNGVLKVCVNKKPKEKMASTSKRIELS